MKGFSGIVGQSGALGLLRGALRSGRVANAYLFEGMGGVGKATTALGMAQELNCEARAEEGACGQCTACRTIAEGLHPDVVTLSPQGAFIKIAQVRQVAARGAFRPHAGGARMVLLDPADALNLEAANALLKVLEEPPQGTHFILISSTPERLPLTVRSRCQRVRFRPLAAQEVEALLQAHHGTEPAEAKLVAELCGGSLGRALTLASEEHMSRLRSHAQELTRAAQGTGIGTLLDAAAALKEEKESVPGVLELLRIWFRDALFLASGVAPKGALFRAEAERLASLGAARLRRNIDAVADAEIDLRGNVNLQLCLERMLLRLREC